MKLFSSLFAFLVLASAALAGDAHDLLAEVNRARTAPQQYAAKVQASAGRYRSRSVSEAVAFLKRARPLPPLSMSAGLAQAAQSHVAAQGPRGGFGHGSMGSRLAKFGSYEGVAGENIAYGLSDAVATVVGWIVDEGVPSRSHRRNIFRGNFAVAGGAVGRHARFGTMSVMDFAGGFAEKGRISANRPTASFSNLREL